MAVDLHIHSTASDGSLQPQEIVDVAIAKGLYAIAITDHDTVAGVEPALRAAGSRGVHVLPGVEISVDFAETEIHILGYFIDLDHKPLLDAMEKVRRGRLYRAEEMVRRLQNLGVGITLEDVLEESGDGAIGRPHVARALVKVGAVSTPQEAFDRYLARGKPAYVPRYKLSPEEAVQLIIQAGGMPVFAHPGLARRDDMIDTLIPAGLLGIEAYHTEHSAAETQKYINMARRRGLFITGGSDSHGPKGPIPVEIGSVCVPDQCADRLMEWAAEHNRLFV
ncbi:MAG: PHP domain-containing protein [Armatimonadetes bacterium]|nr:PHP domain-containing protein [Armatimonadota bacterium]